MTNEGLQQFIATKSGQDDLLNLVNQTLDSKAAAIAENERNHEEKAALAEQHKAELAAKEAAHAEVLAAKLGTALVASGRQIQYIAEARQAARNFWNAYHTLIAMQTEWNALDYANTLADGTGDNAGITHAEMGAAIFDTANEVKLRIFDTAFKTNLAKLL